MKKLYTTLFLSAAALFTLGTVDGFAQNGRKATLSDFHATECKACVPHTEAAVDTFCNVEGDDTLAVYYADGAPFDSGWATGHNAYGDMGWAERYFIWGNSSVIGGAYFLYEKSGSATSGGTATGKIYSTNGKPNTALGTANIPYASIVSGGVTLFAFGTPVSVADSFYMAFEVPAYSSLSGPDTIGVVTTRQGNRSTNNANQNCAKWSDGLWYNELTQNFGLKVNYMLCAIANINTGVENYVSQGDLKLFAAYPNPSTSEVTINFALENASKTNIQIYDAQGKSMMNMDKGTLSSGMHNEKLDVASLPAGNYFYGVMTENGNVFSRFTVAK